MLLLWKKYDKILFRVMCLSQETYLSQEMYVHWEMCLSWEICRPTKKFPSLEMFFLREMCISQEKKSAKNSGKMSGRSLRQIIYLHQDRSFVFIFHRLSRKMLKLFPLSSLPLRNMTYLRNASSLLLDSLSSNMALARNVSPPKNVCPLRNVFLLRIGPPPKKNLSP